MDQSNASGLPRMHGCRRRLSTAARQTATALLVVMMLPAVAAMGQDTLRCRGRLVKIGDTAQQVRKCCGGPDDIHTEERDPNTWIARYDYDPYGRPRLPYLTRGPIHVENWTYDFGPNRLPYFLRFENGRLVGIASGHR